MTVEVRVVTPEREVWSGGAEMLIARGVDGEVGILGGHAPLLARLAIGPLRVLREGQPEVRAVVDGGFLHVTSEGGSTRADVLATGAALPDEIDVEAVRRRVDEIRGGAAELGEAATATALARAQARLDLVG
jgi:F-type H+-transporting ATPase subunit epsilon